jgi:hypothetical protein
VLQHGPEYIEEAEEKIEEMMEDVVIILSLDVLF